MGWGSPNLILQGSGVTHPSRGSEVELIFAPWVGSWCPWPLVSLMSPDTRATFLR